MSNLHTILKTKFACYLEELNGSECTEQMKEDINSLSDEDILLQFESIVMLCRDKKLKDTYILVPKPGVTKEATA